MAECIDTGLNDKAHVSDDLEFTFAARVRLQSLKSDTVLTDTVQDWSERVSLGNMEGYRAKFEKMQTYFKPQFADATKVGNEMIKTIEENLRSRQKA